MSSSEEEYRNKNPPYIDDGRLLINTRLSEIERQQNEDKKYQREYDRKQLRFNKLLTIFTGLLFATSVVSDALVWRYVSLTKQSAEAARSSADTAVGTLESSKQSFKETLGQIQAQTAAQQQAAGAQARSASAAKSAADASMVQANAARDSADNAKNSLEATIGGFHLDQRPWVIPYRFRLDAEIESLKDIKVLIWEENTGKTPALEVIPEGEPSLSELEPPQPDFSNATPIISVGILPPGGRDFHFSTEGSHLKAKLLDVAAYRDDRKRIYVQGIIRYRDSFNDPHWTSFCIWHKYGTPPEEFGYCEHGNEVDRQKTNK